MGLGKLATNFIPTLVFLLLCKLSHYLRFNFVSRELI